MSLISNNIKLLRSAFGLEQKELGVMIGKSKGLISHYERGGNVMPIEEQKLARIFGITPDQLRNHIFSLAEAEALASEKSGASRSVAGQNNGNGFRNDAARRFHDWFILRFDAGELDDFDTAVALQASDPRSFWYDLHEGNTDVTAGQLLVAQEKFGIDPGYVLGIHEYPEERAPQAAAAEDEEEYSNLPITDESGKQIGEVIDAILTKHKTPRATYSERRLKVKPRSLQRFISGDITPSFAHILRIAEDHGESLDVFRTIPLPKGHLLETISNLKALVQRQDELIALLQQQRA